MFTLWHLSESNKNRGIVCDLFIDLIDSCLLPCESNTILEAGIELLKEGNLSQTQLDQILTGTLLYALAQHDSKYPRDPYCGEVAMGQIRQIAIDSPNMSAADFIFCLGNKTLIGKAITFTGQFSPNAKIQSIITKALPAVEDNYFAVYGIKKEPLPKGISRSF